MAGFFCAARGVIPGKRSATLNPGFFGIPAGIYPLAGGGVETTVQPDSKLE